MNSPYKQELITAIQTCARLCTDIATSPLIVTDKDDFAIGAVADLFIQSFLNTVLKTAFPDHKIVSEEDAAKLSGKTKLRETGLKYLNNEPNTPSDNDKYAPVSMERQCNIIDQAYRNYVIGHDIRTWIFDPIDGTRAVKDYGAYAVSLAHTTFQN